MRRSRISSANPFDALERRSGDGSTEVTADWLDENSNVHPNHWSNARTTLRVSDAPPHKRDLFRDLKKANAGKGEDDRKSTLREAKILKDAHTFCVICDLDDSQREHVIDIIQESDISSNNYGGKPYEKIILAVMCLVVDESISNPEHMDTRLTQNERFEQLMESVGMDIWEMQRMRQMVRKRTDYFDNE